MKIGNAPCSWGTIENIEGNRLGYGQMLDELADTGYVGTELGDWGFMPTEPETLAFELDARSLELIGSWVTVRLYEESSHRNGAERAIQTAQLMAKASSGTPIINIGPDHSSVPARHVNTGRIRPEHGLDEAGWQVYTRGAERVAKEVLDFTGLLSAFHPHGSTYVETPDEVDSFLAQTDPALVGLCYDTGHFALGGGDPVEGIFRYADRIRSVHFKDFNPEVVEQARREHMNYTEMIGVGLFTELGGGSVDFPAVLAALHEIGYEDWITVEQDVLPGMGKPKISAQRNRDYLRSIGL
jgi:inosose dehydratase